MTKKKPRLSKILLRQDELNKCVNCGLCQSVCPTFLASQNESKTARGKIILLKDMLEGAIEPSAKIAEIFDDCLTCYACQSICPSGVHTERLWTAARDDLAELSLFNRTKRTGLSWSIGKPVIFKAITRIGGLFGNDPAKPDSENLDDAIPFPVKSAPILRSLNEVYPAVGKKHGSVGLLIGCSVNLYAPSVAIATIKILNLAGYQVIIPKNQVCCGAPAINNGAWNTARKLAIKTMSVFNNLNLDYVTSCDATCAGAMISDYAEIFSDDIKLKKNVELFSAKVVQLGEIIRIAVDSGWLSFKKTSQKVTVHDSCHSTHYLKGRTDWRSILHHIDSIEVVEMRESAHCCGFGGSFSFLHKEDAGAIAGRKLRNAIETGVKTVLVGSPGCALRLRTTHNNNNLEPIRIVHSIELLSELACKGIQKEKSEE